MTTTLGKFGRWALAFGIALAAGLAVAQLTEQDVLDTGPANESYEQAVRGDGLSAEVVYLRPETPFSPDQEIEIAVPETPEARRVSTATERWIWGAIFAAIIIFVIVVFLLNAGGIGARFGKTSEDRVRDREDETGPLGVARDGQPVEGFLARLAQMADKREALILLVSRALEEAADANGVRLGRAQTARDVVRSLPTGWMHMAALRDLVRAVELVHFGGRDLSDGQWEDCLAAARPIFPTEAA